MPSLLPEKCGQSPLLELESYADHQTIVVFFRDRAVRSRLWFLRAAIIDLDISAPDRPTAGRSRTFTASTGAATLYIELFDSVSGAIIGRAADRQAARRAGGRVSWSSGVTNTAEARRMFGRWADALRDFLDQHYTKDAKEARVPASTF